MLNRFRPALKMALAGVALDALVPLAACNQAIPEQASYSPGLPDLPATLPLALDEPRPVTYAPAASALPRARRIQAARVADPDDYYAWADDAWSYYDALGEAPPDYGFNYDDIEPWAWQGYDDSLMFVEPLDYGYRSYHYRPGEEYPYFIRDPEWGYGYDDGHLAVVYDTYGGILPYDDYDDGPWLDYASSYYDRGHRLYGASRNRHPVIAANWYDVRPAYTGSFLDWEEDLWRQPNWSDYHERTFEARDRHWRQERARRQAETVRYAAWQDQGFQALPPPRAIPRNWRRADWARDERWFAPAERGFEGGRDDQQRAARRERMRMASLTRETAGRDRARLAELREQVRRRPDAEPRRTERMAEVRRQFQDRQVQLASRTDRSALRERSLLERQERALARAQQNELQRDRVEIRRERGAEPQRSAGLERRQLRERSLLERQERAQQNESRRERAEIRRERGADPQRSAGLERRQLREAAREQRLNQADRRRPEVQAPSEVQQRRQQRAESQEQRLNQGGRRRQEFQAPREVQQRRQQRAESQERHRTQVEARAQAQRRQEAQVQSRAEGRQRREGQGQARAESQQRRQAQVQARGDVENRRQAQAQARAETQQRRQAQEQARGERQRRQAEGAASQQRQSQARAEAGARAAQREQARQAAEQQRAGREQARQQRAQGEVQARAQAGARAAQREQARQAGEQQRAGREQARQAVEQQRAQRQQAQSESRSRPERVARTEAAQADDGNVDRERRGRRQD